MAAGAEPELAPVGFMLDSNVLLDIAIDGQDWQEWSVGTVIACRRRGGLVTNQAIFAEVSAAFRRIEGVRAFFREGAISFESIPWDAAFLAGHVHLDYRRRGGTRTATLPDFFIGAHALVRGYTLVTRDARRYRTYFPTLSILAPDG